MKPAPFHYHDPQSLEDLVGLLSRLENAKLLAGGQSLMPMLNMRYVVPDHVIDINRIQPLQGIRLENGKMRIGAMTRQRSLERNELIAKHCPIIGEALKQVGHMQTRSRGTIGGSLCHLDPAAELPGMAALYDAELTVAGAAGSRRLPMEEWGLGFMTPNIGPDEVLTEITFNPWAEPHGYAFVEFARRHGDFAIAGAGCLLAVDAQGKVKRAAIALVGVDVKPLRLSEAEQSLIGLTPSQDDIVAAAAHAARFEALSDAQISTSYRQRVAGTMTRRALTLALSRARSAVHV